MVDTISFDRLFMCKLEKTNDIKQTHVVYTLKKTKNNKIRKCIYLLYYLAEVVYTPEL